MSTSGAKNIVQNQNPALKRWARWDTGANQRPDNAYWRDVAESDPEFRSVYMCIELAIGDETHRITSRPNGLSATSLIDSTVYQYLPGLIGEPQIDQTCSAFGSQQASVRSIQITMSGERLKPYTIISRGRVLCGIAEVSLMVNGMNHDQRWVLMRADITGASFGTVKQLVTLTIKDPKTTGSLFIPDITADSTRWSLIGDMAVGMRYPYVINGYSKVPCLPVVYNVPADGKFLVSTSQHPWTVSAVYVNGVEKTSGDATYPWSAQTTTDALGDPVLLIDFTSGAATWADADCVHATITPDTASGGPQSMGVLDVVRYLLRGWTGFGNVGLNNDLFSFAAARMPSCPPKILINGSGENASRVTDYVERTLLPCYPMISLVFEGRGYGPIVIDRRYTAIDGTREAICVGKKFPLIERLSDYQETEKADLYNAFEVRYSYDVLLNTFTKVKQRNATNSAVCAYSESKDVLGAQRLMDTLELLFVDNDSTADYILDWLAAHYALPSYYVEWSVYPWAFQRYRRGMNVTYTDSDVGFSSCAATIERLIYSKTEGCRVGFRVWHPFWSRFDGSGGLTSG